MVVLAHQELPPAVAQGEQGAISVSLVGMGALAAVAGIMALVVATVLVAVPVILLPPEDRVVAVVRQWWATTTSLGWQQEHV